MLAFQPSVMFLHVKGLAVNFGLSDTEMRQHNRRNSFKVLVAHISRYFGHGDQQIIFVVLALGLGCLMYFLSPVEPDWLWLLGLYGALIGIWWRWQIMPTIAFWIISGVCLAKFHIAAQPTTMLSAPQTIDASARLTAVRPTKTGGWLVTLCDVQQTQAIQPIADLPNCAQIYTKYSLSKDIAPGDKVAGRLKLEPIGPDTLPNAYDGRLRDYVADIGARGFAFSGISRLEQSSDFSLARLRYALLNRMGEELTGNSYGLAAAMMIGKRGYVNAEAQDALRDSGLAHLLAISGLHMGMLSAAAFFAIQYLAACSPALTYRVTPKKLAACGAFMFALAYLLLSGMAVSSVRAFIMVSIALLAIITERRVISLRSVALAALAILIISPHSVMEIGFQLSFAATAALVHLFEIWPRKADDHMGIVNKIGRQISAGLVATFIAQAAIAPFALYYFGTVSFTGALANIVVMPLMSVIIMPLCLFGLVCLALDMFPIAAPFIDLSMNILLSIARYFANLPGASVRMWQMSDSSFIILVSMFLVLLMARQHYTVGIIAVGTVIMVFFLEKPPPSQIWITGERPIIRAYMRDQLAHGQTAISYYGARANGRKSQNFAKQMGVDPKLPANRLKPTCDQQGCSFNIAGLMLALPKGPPALALDCMRADYIIAEWKGANCTGIAKPSNTEIISGHQLSTHPLILIKTRAGWQRKIYKSSPPTRPWQAGYSRG